MSGGSYNYFYSRIEDVAGQVARSDGLPKYSNPTLRRAFAKHLLKVAAAMRAIEWNDSSDGDEEETALIEACLSEGAELEQAVADAEVALKSLQDAVDRAKGITQ